MKVAIEMTDGLSVSGTPTVVSGRPGDKVPASVSYTSVSDSNGVFNVGTLLGPDHQNAAESTYNYVTLPVEVDSNAVVNGQCLTATLTGNPPPGTGPLDDDISDNVAKLCLSVAGTVAGTQEEPFKSGQFNAFAVYPCVDVTEPPCDSTDDVRVRAVHPSTGQVLGPGTALIQINPTTARTYDGHENGSNVLQSVNDGNTVSWQTSIDTSFFDPGAQRYGGLRSGIQLFYSRLPFDGHVSDWKRPTFGISARDVDGNTPPPGKVFLRSTFSGNEFRRAESPDYEEVPTSLSTSAVTAIKLHYFLEFEKLGTYKIGWQVIVPRNSLHGSEDCFPNSATPPRQPGILRFRNLHLPRRPHSGAGGAGRGGASLPPGQRAFSIVAVNHGPDAAPAARVTVTGLPESATVNYTASRGSFDFDSEAGAWVWDIGELLSKNINQARKGRDGEILTIATGAASQVTAAIENTQDYSVCIDSSAADVELSSPSETACTTEDATNSWHSTVYYDYDDGNDEAVIRQVTGSGEARLTAALVSRDQTVVSVSWPDISTLNRRPVIHYEVARSMDGGRNWRLLADRWPVTTYFDAGSSAGQSVRYRVRTVNDLGHKGIWSAGAGSGQSAKTPAQPQNVTGDTSGAGAITLSWEPPASDGGSPITGYQLQASATGEGGWSHVCSTSDAAERTCDHAGLGVGAIRFYRVAARNVNGLGPWSDPPAVGSTEFGVPDAPRSLSAQAIQAVGVDAVRLTWTAPARDNGSPIHGYEVEGSLDGIDWTWLGNTDGKSATDLVDSGSVLWFEPGQTRHYRVRALNEAGDGQWSSTARASSAAVPPEGMYAWAQPNGQNAIDIFWGEPHLKGAATITGYQLQVCVPPKECTALNNDSDYSRVASPSGTTLSYTHTGLQPGDERYYRVRARNSAGWSEWSWPASATTLDLGLDTGLPGAPRLTARANGAAEIKLSWTAADARGSEIDTYELEVSGDGLYWDRLAYNWPDQTEFLHEGLDGGTRNYYRVRALVLHEGRSIGGQWSTVVNATTVAGAPAEPLSLSGEGVAQASDDSKHDHVVLTLKIRADSTVTRYQVERSVDGGNSGWKQVSASKSASTSEDCTIDGTQTKCETVTLKDNTRDLFPGTYYYYRVAAVNSKGIGPYAYANVLTAGDWIHAPSRPRLLALSNVGRTAATVTWIEPKDDGGVAVTGYEYQLVRICGAGETEDCGDWPQDEDGSDEVRTTTAKSVRLSGLESGGGYHFRVRAVNRAEEITGKGNWSHDIYIDLSAN